MRETRTREHPSTGVLRAQRDEQPLDDWLGDVSDDDWDEGAAAPAAARGGGSPGQGLRADDEAWPEDAPASRSTRADDDLGAHRAAIERRRYTAGLVLLLLVGIAVAVPILILRGGSDGSPADVSTTTPPVTTTPATSTPATTTPTTTTPSSGSDTTTTETTPTDTTPSTGATTFTLPDGTKLRAGEDNDPELVRQLQQALTSAGYDPGTADGTYGPQTTAAVKAFQEANGLSADGVVGPDTAAALNSALAGG